jgi:hypothetical protein
MRKNHGGKRKGAEEIKDIIGYEGLYQITSSGRVFRLARKKRLVNGESMDLPPIELQVNGKVQYPCVSLNKGGHLKTFYMHRLVAIHFVPNDNPLIKREINHKDKNIFNYAADNLEWCTRSENVKHAKKNKKK